ncbi:redox-sensing transcriptional repressor Rex [Gemmatimonadota bacterium]
MAHLKKLVLERLMRYYRFLSTATVKKPIETITSAQIAKALDIDPTQVRKDFGAIGLVGIGRVGYETCEVCRAIRLVMGFDEAHEGVLIGAGHLGGALLAYTGFERYGFHFVAAFDTDPKKVGKEIDGVPVRSMRGVTPYIKRHGIRVAVLTVPVEISQTITDRLVAVGVKAIWNFTPTQLSVPDGVLVRNEHISLGLSEITYHLQGS